MPKVSKVKSLLVGRPDRLKINFRDLRPSYELYSEDVCTKADLLAAGLLEEIANALVWNSHSHSPMNRTLIRPEEWFWTDRDWWTSEKGAPHVVAMYKLAGGSFSDLTPAEQAALLGVEIRQLSGTKGQGNRWRTADGKEVDIVRYVRGLLMDEGYIMALAYPQSINLLVRNHARKKFKKDIEFIGQSDADAPNLRKVALAAIESVFNDPEAEWDSRPQYYFNIYNGLRSTKDFDKNAMMDLVRVLGVDFYSQFLRHYWLNQTYENEMMAPNLPDLIGRLGESRRFFFVTQKASFRWNVSRFVRDYARPLGFGVTLIQLAGAAKK